MKKCLSVLLAAVLTAGLVSGCKGTDSSATSSETGTQHETTVGEKEETAKEEGFLQAV